MKLFQFPAPAQTKFCWNIDGGPKETSPNSASSELNNAELKAENIIQTLEEKFAHRIQDHDELKRVLLDYLAKDDQNFDKETEKKEYEKNLKELADCWKEISLLVGHSGGALNEIKSNIDANKVQEFENKVFYEIKDQKEILVKEGVDLNNVVISEGRKILENRRVSLKKYERGINSFPENISIPKDLESRLKQSWSKEFSDAIANQPTVERALLEANLNKLLKECADQNKKWDNRGGSLLANFLNSVTPAEFVQVLRIYEEGIPEVRTYNEKEYRRSKAHLPDGSVRLWEKGIQVQQDAPSKMKVDNVSIDNAHHEDQENYDFMTPEGRDKLLGILITDIREKYGDNLTNVTNLKIQVSRNALRYVKDDSRELLQSFAQGKGEKLQGAVDYQKLASAYWSTQILSEIQKSFPNWKGKVEIEQSKLGATGAPSVYTLSSEYSQDSQKADQLLSFGSCTEAYPEEVQDLIRPFLEQNGLSIAGDITEKNLREHPKFTKDLGNQLYKQILAPNEGVIKQAYEQWNQTNIQVISENKSPLPPQKEQGACGVAVIFNAIRKPSRGGGGSVSGDGTYRITTPASTGNDICGVGYHGD